MNNKSQPKKVFAAVTFLFAVFQANVSHSLQECSGNDYPLLSVDMDSDNEPVFHTLNTTNLCYSYHTNNTVSFYVSSPLPSYVAAGFTLDEIQDVQFSIEMNQSEVFAYPYIIQGWQHIYLTVSENNMQSQTFVTLKLTGSLFEGELLMIKGHCKTNQNADSLSCSMSESGEIELALSGEARLDSHQDTAGVPLAPTFSGGGINNAARPEALLLLITSTPDPVPAQETGHTRNPVVRVLDLGLDALFLKNSQASLSLPQFKAPWRLSGSPSFIPGQETLIQVFPSTGSEGEDGDDRKPPRKKARDHITRPKNAFFIFMAEQREQVVKDLTSEEEGYPHQNEVTTEISRRWHSLSEEEQTVYRQKAYEEKAEHSKRNPDYKYKPRKLRKKGRPKRQKATPGEAREFRVVSTQTDSMVSTATISTQTDSTASTATGNTQIHDEQQGATTNIHISASGEGATFFINPQITNPPSSGVEPQLFGGQLGELLGGLLDSNSGGLMWSFPFGNDDVKDEDKDSEDEDTKKKDVF